MISSFYSVEPSVAVRQAIIALEEKGMSFEYPWAELLKNPHPVSDKDFVNHIAARALNLSKTRKVAVCCVAGGFSGTNIASRYLMLKRQSQRRVLKAKQRKEVRARQAKKHMRRLRK